jgi:predicted transcriptional regulator of viral defense system
MKKQLFGNSSYKGISSLESALLESIEKSRLPVFGVEEARHLAGFSKARVNNLLASLSRKGIAGKISRNNYFLKKNLVENRFAIAASAFAPAYVSFWTALSFYGFTEQQPSIVQVAVTRQHAGAKALELSVQPVKIRKSLFFGYGLEAGFPMALREKALIDSGLNLEYCGGFNEWAKCFRNAWPELNKALLLEFLLKANSKSLNSRIGYLIEELELKAGKGFLKRLLRNSSKGFVKLSPSGGKAKEYSKKWKIIINASIASEAVL